MKVTGYQLREALRKWTTKMEVLKVRFDDSIWEFPGEQKKMPLEVSQEWEKVMTNVALLQCAQQRYNREVSITLTNTPREETMTLAMAVKLIGMYGRLESAWRKATIGNGKDRWDRGSGASRSKDTEYAKKSLSQEKLAECSDNMSNYTSALRAAIARGNATEIDIGEVLPELL